MTYRELIIQILENRKDILDKDVVFVAREAEIEYRCANLVRYSNLEWTRPSGEIVIELEY